MTMIVKTPMPEADQTVMSRRVLRTAVPVAAVVAAGVALFAITADWDPGKAIVVPVVLVCLAVAVLTLSRQLGIARRRAAERGVDQNEERTRLILDRSHEAYIGMDDLGIVTHWNAAAETMFGWKRSEATGRELAKLIIPNDLRAAHTAGLKRFRETGYGPMIGSRTEVIARHRDGAEIPVELSITCVEEADGGYAFHGFVRDITERRLLEAQQAEMLAQAEHSARSDALTALPNRRAWDEELGRELARARRAQVPLCIAVLDLDHFKNFNDSNGHQAGDRLLRQASTSWKLALRASDFLARHGGEEFAALLPSCDIEEAMTVIERLREVTPYGQTVSAGVAQWNGYESADALIDRADLALYDAKRSGRNRATAAA